MSELFEEALQEKCIMSADLIGPSAPALGESELLELSASTTAPVVPLCPETYVPLKSHEQPGQAEPPEVPLQFPSQLLEPFHLLEHLPCAERALGCHDPCLLCYF